MSNNKSAAKMRAEARLLEAQTRAAALEFKKKSKSQEKKVDLLDMFSEIRPFRATNGEAYAEVNINGHAEVLTLSSSDMADYIAMRLHTDYKEVPVKRVIESILAIFHAKASFTNEEPREVFSRVGHTDQEIYLNLNDTLHRFVKITSDGWEVIHSPPVMFCKATGAEALPYPQRGGSMDDILEFINIDPSDLPLVTAWMIGTLMPRGPFPILILVGGHGSAKSCACRYIKGIIDPAGKLDRPPTNDRDFYTAANNCWVYGLDNVSIIQPWLSDDLCRLATGSKISIRRLYYNAEVYLFKMEKPVMLNSIGNVATAPDLLDRSLLIFCPELTSRIPERVLDSRYEEARPSILGALLDTIVTALGNVDYVNISNSTRMADFFTWVMAAFGEEGQLILNKYRENISRAHEVGLESSPVAIAIIKMIDDKKSFSGTALDLINLLPEYINSNILRSPDWPSNPQKLSNILERIIPNLIYAGIRVNKSSTRSNRGSVWNINSLEE